MSFLRLVAPKCFGILAKTLIPNATGTVSVNCSRNQLHTPIIANNYRLFSLTTTQCCDANENAEGSGRVSKKRLKLQGTERDRSNKIVSVKTSIEYLQSSAYKSTYSDRPVWEGYRRVHKGGFPRRKTRRSCIVSGIVWYGSPCPICRDEYLVLDYTNLELLKQFISPQTGEIESYEKTGLCQKQHMNLRIAIERAYDLGLLSYEVPFRNYDYSLYYNVGKGEN